MMLGLSNHMITITFLHTNVWFVLLLFLTGTWLEISLWFTSRYYGLRQGKTHLNWFGDLQKQLVHRSGSIVTLFTVKLPFVVKLLCEMDKLDVYYNEKVFYPVKEYFNQMSNDLSECETSY